MGAENLEEVEEFDRIMQSVAEGTYHPSHSATAVLLPSRRARAERNENITVFFVSYCTCT